MSDKRRKYDETSFLLESPANAARLRAAVKDANGDASGLVLTKEEFVALADDPADFLARHAGRGLN